MSGNGKWGGWELSEFGSNLSEGSGIGELMDDLGHAIAQGSGKIFMLGGGQPAQIPEMTARWRARMTELLESRDGLERMLGNYEPPAGSTSFRSSLAKLFAREFSWPISEKNIAVTAGGQTAFFFLLNSLAGRMADGRKKRILLPLVPEYIGYADQSVGTPLFRGIKPRIERRGEHSFKYTVDFSQLTIEPTDAAICVSRPTNPTGNVLTDEEVAHLAALAREHNIPLIIDNAYGAPFPNVIFGEATPVWDENIVLTLSLSKLGLPGTRTGIVVAREEVIRGVTSLTSIAGLANGNVGQAIVQPMIDSGEILHLSNDVVRPFYEEKSRQAQAWVSEFWAPSLPYRVHVSEGALFLWVWFEGLPITARELYERLKLRNVLVVPGNYFFFGLEDDWRHRNECLRINFSLDQETVREGIRIIGEEVAKAYASP